MLSINKLFCMETLSTSSFKEFRPTLDVVNENVLRMYNCFNEDSFDGSFSSEEEDVNWSSHAVVDYIHLAIANINNHQSEINAYIGTNIENVKSNAKIIVIDWCIRVYYEMSLTNETLFLGISLFNIITRVKKVRMCHLQLFAATALWIASKIEESITPTLSDFVTVCGDNYSTREFYCCEDCIIRQMNYDVAFATQQFYLRLALGSGNVTDKYQKVANIVALTSLFLDTFNDPQTIASAVLYLSSMVTHENEYLWKVSFPINEMAVRELLPSLIKVYKEQLGYKKGIVYKKYHELSNYNQDSNTH